MKERRASCLEMLLYCGISKLATFPQVLWLESEFVDASDSTLLQRSEIEGVNLCQTM
jgi:hypothetical protein